MRCYGFERDDVTVRTSEAEVLRDAAARLLAGDSLRAVVLDMNRAGHVTSTGRPWTAVTLKRLLLNARLAGVILDPATQDQLRAKLTDPNRGAQPRHGGGPPRKYLLTGGLLECGTCGKPLQSQPSQHDKRGYVCRAAAPTMGCGRIRIAAESLENEVAARVVARLSSPNVRKRLAETVTRGTDEEVVKKEMQAVTDQHAELGRDYGDGLIDRTAFLAAQQQLRGRANDLRARLAALARIQALPLFDDEAGLATWWTDPGTPIDRKRDLVAAVLERIVVHPAKRPGPAGSAADRITFIWR